MIKHTHYVFVRKVLEVTQGLLKIILLVIIIYLKLQEF